MNNLIDLPKSAPSAKMSIAEPTIDFKYPALTELMEQLQKEIDRIITIVDWIILIKYKWSLKQSIVFIEISL